jgi:hypothetical protein
LDETGVFFKDTTRKTFHIKGEDCPGGKRSKERITAAFCASLTGEKLEPLIIGKSKKPRCFGKMFLSTSPLSPDMVPKTMLFLLMNASSQPFDALNSGLFKSFANFNAFSFNKGPETLIWVCLN